MQIHCTPSNTPANCKFLAKNSGFYLFNLYFRHSWDLAANPLTYSLTIGAQIDRNPSLASSVVTPIEFRAIEYQDGIETSVVTNKTRNCSIIIKLNEGDTVRLYALFLTLGSMNFTTDQKLYISRLI